MAKVQSQEIERIRTMDRDALLRLWDRLVAGKGEAPSKWTKGHAFEHLVLRAFQIEQAIVQWPYTVNLGDEIVEEIDGAIHSHGLTCICQSKNWMQKVNVEPLAMLRNQLLRRPAATIGLVFSSSGFTDPAIALARYFSPQTILIWNGDEIEYGLRHATLVPGLHAKHRHAVEHGLPDFDIRSMD